MSFLSYVLPVKNDSLREHFRGIGGTAASGRRSAPVPLPFRTRSAKNLTEKD